MNLKINKNVKNVDELCYDHLVVYTILKTDNGDVIKTIQNFSVSDNIKIPTMEHCVQFDIIEDAKQPNINHGNYMLEIEMLKNKSCYSLASLIISNYETYNVKEVSLVSCFINIITPFGLITLNVTDVVENDELYELAGILDLIYVLYINNGLELDNITDTLQWVTLKPQETISPEGKEILYNYLISTITIKPIN